MKAQPIRDIDFEEISSIELLEYISFKEDFPEEAKDAFVQFCYRFEKDMKQKAEKYCEKFGYNEVVALEIAHCTFARVWKYPTFKPEKAKSKDLDKAILLWMYPILYTQIIKYGVDKYCADPSEEENLSIIENTEELLDMF